MPLLFLYCCMTASYLLFKLSHNSSTSLHQFSPLLFQTMAMYGLPTCHLLCSKLKGSHLVAHPPRLDPLRHLEVAHSQVQSASLNLQSWYRFNLMRSSTTSREHEIGTYQHVYLMCRCYSSRPPAAEPCARLLPPLSRRSRAPGNQSPETIIKWNLLFFNSSSYNQASSWLQEIHLLISAGCNLELLVLQGQ